MKFEKILHLRILTNLLNVLKTWNLKKILHVRILTNLQFYAKIYLMWKGEADNKKAKRLSKEEIVKFDYHR